MIKTEVNSGPLKEYGKYYFRQLLAQAPPNLKWGDTLTFRIQYLGPDGKVHSQVSTEINMENRIIKFRAWLIKEKRMVDVMSFGWNKGWGGCTEIHVDVPDFDPYKEIILKEKPAHRKDNQRIGLEWYVNKPDLSPFAIMQFTGLKDANGREIYEGDIVLYRLTNSNGVPTDTKIIGDIYYEYHGFTARNLGGIVFEVFEVIGNIYENPDLIN